MHPVLFEFGPFSLHTYGLMMAIAFAAGIWIAMKRAPKRGIESKFILDLAVISLIAGLAGARLTYVLTHWREFEGRWLDVISPIQSDGKIGIAGLVLLGGVIGGFAAAWYLARRKQQSFLNVTDVMMPSLALGIAFGRLGCFFNGCCFGLPGGASWCVIFPEDSLAGSVFPHTHIHPTQLYETLAMLALFAGLLLYDRKPRAVGILTGLFLLGYGVWRYYLEGIRWYESSMILAQSDAMRFTLSQFISVCMVIAGIIIILRARKSPPKELPA